MPNPTSGFQLSALPQPLSFPTNIGMVDVGQMQKAYANAMQNVQDTALFGQRVAANRAALDLQEQQARQQQRLLAPQEQAQRLGYQYQAGKAQQGIALLPDEQAALKEKFGADTAKAVNDLLAARAAKPYVAPTTEAKSATELQASLAQLGQGQLSGGIFGAPIIPFPNISGVTQPPTPQTVQQTPQPAAPQPTQQPQTQLPSVSISQPAEITPAGTALSTFAAKPQSALSSVSAAPSPATAEITPVGPTQQAQATQRPDITQQSEKALPPNVKLMDDGNYNVSGVIVPAVTYKNPQVQSWIAQGYVPIGTPKRWEKIDKDRMRSYEILVTPSGFSESNKPISGKELDLIEKVQDARQLASSIDPSYEAPSGLSDPAAITHASNVYAKQEMTNPNQVLPATNPARGIRVPKLASEAIKKARDNAVAQLDNESNFRTDIENVRSNLNEFRELNKRLPTGPVTAGLVGKYLTYGGNIEDFVQKLTGSDASFIKENSDILQRMKVIHDTSIPGLIRSLNGKVGAAGAQTGGAAGIGRIMFNEVPWLAGTSPSVLMGQAVNDALISKNLAMLDRLTDKMDYRQQFFNDYGHLQGSLSNFDKYERSNPYFDAGTGQINNNRVPWTQGLMSPQWREENGDSVVRKYNNAFAPKPSAPKVDITKAPAGLDAEGFRKWVEQQSGQGTE